MFTVERYNEEYLKWEKIESFNTKKDAENHISKMESEDAYATQMTGASCYGKYKITNQN